ncbi:MAG: tetratricopeptide repeat protein [Acidobacteriaceae bacterium]
MRKNDIDIAVVIAAAAAILIMLPGLRRSPRPGVLAAEAAPQPIAIDYPLNRSVFPPDITPPTFLWLDPAEAASRWRIEFRFGDGSPAMSFETTGPHPVMGAIDQRCISTTNELPKFTPEQAAAHTWMPDAAAWEKIKKHSVTRPAQVIVSGFDAGESPRPVSRAEVSLSTSKDPVGAPIFYRDVPLMPSETEKGVIKPLAANAIHLIEWRLRSIDQTQSRVVLQEMHTCANCHSFSRDGRTFGMDMDGPQNDKGLYAVVSLKPQTVIRNQDMIHWNPTYDRQFAFNRVGFMSQVSPNGRYVLTMLTPGDRPPQNNYYVANFKDYRFLQVFYPTRGVLYWYDRATGERHPLPGADDSNLVQTNGVWSPDGKYIVFARAESKEPYSPGVQLATHSNDPNETQIRYDLYSVPFNGGQGGKAEPVAGASGNGMSNSFPKVSPDGRWIVFVEAHNAELMRPDSQLYIVPFTGGTARRLDANMYPMNSWHSWSPNGHWLVFSSKSRGPYTRMYLTHIDDDGNSSPAIFIDNPTAANRAVNLPEFVNIASDGLMKIDTPAVDMYRDFDRAVELAEAGQDAAAVAEWKKLVVEDPDDARIHNNLGAALIRTSSFAQAIPELDKALDLNPQYNIVHVNLAHALLGAGQTSQAVAEYKKALDLYPESADLHNSYGNALRAQGQRDDAVQQYSIAIGIDPKLADAHNNLGLALLGESKPDQTADAEQEFRTAISLRPNFADAENNLGTLVGQEGKDAEAEQLFRDAIRDNGVFARAMVNLAATLASEGRFQEAATVAQRALQLEPGNKDAQRLRAMIETQQNH